MQGGLADRDHALFAALAHHAGGGAFHINIPNVQRQKFGGPDSAGVKQFKDDAVAVADGCARVHTVEELAHLGMGQHAGGEQLLILGRDECIGQVLMDVTLLGQAPQEAAQHGNAKPDGFRSQRQAARCATGREVAEPSFKMFTPEPVSRLDLVAAFHPEEKRAQLPVVILDRSGAVVQHLAPFEEIA